jgi:hypothetical protein
VCSTTRTSRSLRRTCTLTGCIGGHEGVSHRSLGSVKWLDRPICPGGRFIPSGHCWVESRDTVRLIDPDPRCSGRYAAGLVFTLLPADPADPAEAA